jgi:hypothetical protein
LCHFLERVVVRATLLWVVMVALVVQAVVAVAAVLVLRRGAVEMVATV